MTEIIKVESYYCVYSQPPVEGGIGQLTKPFSQPSFAMHYGKKAGLIEMLLKHTLLSKVLQLLMQIFEPNTHLSTSMACTHE